MTYRYGCSFPEQRPLTLEDMKALAIQRLENQIKRAREEAARIPELERELDKMKGK